MYRPLLLINQSIELIWMSGVDTDVYARFYLLMNVSHLSVHLLTSGLPATLPICQLALVSYKQYMGLLV
jgi:hypothetical protein